MGKASTFGRQCVAVLAAGLALSACDQADKLKDAAANGATVNGVVQDSYGQAVEGAKVSVYAYSKNLNHFYRPEEVPDPAALTDLATYKVKVDLGELVAKGDPEAEVGTTGADGKFEITGLPVLDGIILVAHKGGYAIDIAGVDEDDGTISYASALQPSSADTSSLDDLGTTITQNFVIAGGKPPFVMGDDVNVVPPNVTPVIPSAPPEPPAPPTVEPPPAPECVVSGDCMPGNVCKAGACGPECTEATAEVDCGVGKACRDSACGPECFGHSDCAMGEICDAASNTCGAEECNAGTPCAGLEQCNGEASGHGYCAPTCTDGGGECDATNQICDLNLGGCRFECLANSDCGDAANPLCANNHCAPAECQAHDDCLAEGKNGGYCNDFACVKECAEGADACGDRGMVCDGAASRCKLECVLDAECEGNAVGPNCEANHCAPAQCAADDDCLAEDKNGGVCAGTRCITQCTPDGDIGGLCGDVNAECPRARCIMPDPNELHPPASTPWTKFEVRGGDDAVIADATATSGIIGANVDLFANGGIVRFAGEAMGAPAGDSLGYLRVQVGDSHCDPVSYVPVAGVFPVWLKDGKLTSDKGEYQEWVIIAGAYQQYQLDLDTEIGNGNESNLVIVAERCGSDDANATPKSALTITLGWDKDKVDADLHVWNEANVETFYGSREGGVRRTSSYGKIDVDDRNGFGPEVFSLNPDVTSGAFTVRARYFAGPVATATTDMTVRVIRRLADGTYADETFNVVATRRSGDVSGWVDLGLFSIGAGSEPIIDTGEPTDAPTEEPAVE